MAFVDRGTEDKVQLVRRVRDYLVAQSAQNVTDSVEGWTLTLTTAEIFLVQMPEIPQEAIVIVPTGGPFLPEDPTRRLTFQIQIRSAHAGVGLPKSQQINRLLRNQWNVLDGFPGQIAATGEPGIAFKDDSGNLINILNYVITSTCPR